MSTESVEKRKVFGLPYNYGVGLLSVLGVVCLYEFYSNVLAGPSVPDTPARRASSAPTAGVPTIATSGSASADAPRKSASTQRRGEEFNPVLRSKRPEDRIDPNVVDPTLRLDLLAKVQAVEASGGSRNLFQMGQPPKVETLAGAEPIVRPPVGPRRPPDPVVAQPPAPPPVLPIPLKFYGFSTIIRDGKKTAYFMDGEDILLAAEGDTLKRRYVVKRIQATSVLMEDTETKRSESIPLTQPEAQG